MEHINQLRKWEEQAKAARQNSSADMDVAKRLIAHGIEATEEIARLKRALDLKEAAMRQLEADVARLELQVESLGSEVKELDGEIAGARIELSGAQIEVSRLSTGLDWINKAICYATDRNGDRLKFLPCCGAEGERAPHEAGCELVALLGGDQLARQEPVAYTKPTASLTFPCGSLGEQIESEGGAA